MPYISKKARSKVWAKKIKDFELGELNYVLTKIILAYLSKGEVNYAELAKIIGMLETMKLELYRRTVVPYENKKKKMHGDVF